MTRRTRLLMVLTMVLVAAPAYAATVSDVIEEVEFRRYYAEPGLGIDINELESLVTQYQDISFVAVRSIAGLDADELAREILDAVGSGTVVVLTPSEVGAVSYDHDDTRLGQALEAVTDTPGDSYLTDFRQFAAAVTGETPATTIPTSGGGGPGAGAGGFPWGWLIFLAALVLFFVVMARRSRRTQEMAAGARLEEARDEIREQMAVIANQILEFSDRADGGDHPEAMEHYRQASAVFGDAEDRLETAAALEDLEKLSDDLDLARWELEAASALAEGRAIPPRPESERPQSCFFDPRHGAGVEEAEIRTAAGAKKVLVCRSDADKLRQGQHPEPRTMEVGGRQVPAPQAPRSHGGLGMDWMDVFSIIVGGMSQGTQYRRPQRRPSLGSMTKRGSGSAPSAPGDRWTGGLGGRTTPSSGEGRKKMGRARRRR